MVRLRIAAIIRVTGLALKRSTGAIVHEQKLPATANSPIAITSNTILVPAGAPKASKGGNGTPQLVAYTVP